MKQAIIIFIFVLMGSKATAHSTESSNYQIRQWTDTVQGISVSGSFLMTKDDKVYIEGLQHQIHILRPEHLTMAQQTYIKNKENQINQINSKRFVSQQNKPFNKADFVWLAMALFIIGIGIVISNKVSRDKFKFIRPIILTGAFLSLFSFTSRVMKTMATTTSPSYIDSAFTPFKPKVNTRWDATYFYVESKGIPDHQMMTGITGWQQQVPIPQCYIGSNAWSIPLNPEMASTPVPVNQNHFLRGAVGLAVNGVPIFNPFTNTGVDAFLDGQLDNFGGHCGRADDYHYHIAPLFLEGKTADVRPIAFALDGFAVYGSKEPDGSTMKTLDPNHGHIGSNGVYHYHGTSSAPYMIGNMVGKVTEDTTLQIIPQASARPVRPSGTPLKGAVITNCKPNATGNGYTLIYTLSGSTDSVEYSWTSAGVYTFNFYKSGVKTTNVYNGFKPCNLPLSLNEIANSAFDISLYPNPTKQNVSIVFSQPSLSEQVELIEIFDMNGKKVYTSNTYKKAIELRHIDAGIYFVKITINKIQLSKKLIIQ